MLVPLLVVATRVLLGTALAAPAPAAPAPMTWGGSTLLVDGDAVWLVSNEALRKLDPDLDVVRADVARPTAQVGPFQLDGASVRGPGGITALPTRARVAATDGRTLTALAGDDAVIRVGADGKMTTMPAKHPVSVAAFTGGGWAVSDADGVWVHRGDEACRVEGIGAEAGSLVGGGDHVAMEVGKGVLVVDARCHPVGAIPTDADATGFTPDGSALWVRSRKTLARYALPTLKRTRFATITPSTLSAVACGDQLCLEADGLRWDLAANTLAPAPVPPPPGGAPAVFYEVRGRGPLFLRVTGTGARVWDSEAGTDVGVELPVQPRSAAVSADGRLVVVSSGDETSLWETATGTRRWTIPEATNPLVVTATAWGSQRSEEWTLRDTATGMRTATARRVDRAFFDLVVTVGERTVSSRDATAPLLGTPPVGTPPVGTPPVGTAPVGAPPLLDWPAVSAPAPAVTPLDEPLARAVAAARLVNGAGPAYDPGLLAGLPHLQALAAKGQARLDALRRLYPGDATNPLATLRVAAAWPASPGPGVGWQWRLRALRPGRGVAGDTGAVDLQSNPVTLPLRPGRPVLVLLTDTLDVSAPLRNTALDPGVDVVLGGGWADTIETVPEDSTLLLWPLIGAHAKGQTVVLVREAWKLAKALGISEPGALFVDPQGRVLAEGTPEQVSTALRMRGTERFGPTPPRPMADARWRYEGPEPVLQVVAAGGGAAFRSAHQVGALGADGHLRWVRRLDASSLAADGDTVLAGAPTGTVALAALDGAPRWTRPGMLLSVAVGAATVGEAGTVLRLDVATGAVLDTLPTAVADPRPGPGATWFALGGAADPVRCGWSGVESLGCAGEPLRIGGLRLTFRGERLEATDARGKVRWHHEGLAATVIDGASFDAARVFAQLGSTAGPWVALDARGAVKRAFASETPVASEGPGHPVYGTEGGAVLAWDPS